MNVVTGGPGCAWTTGCISAPATTGSQPSSWNVGRHQSGFSSRASKVSPIRKSASRIGPVDAFQPGPAPITAFEPSS